MKCGKCGSTYIIPDERDYIFCLKCFNTTYVGEQVDPVVRVPFRGLRPSKLRSISDGS